MTRHRWNPPIPRRPAARRRPAPRRLLAVLPACAIVAAGCTGGDDADAPPEPETTVTTTPIPELSERADPLPVVTPAPQDLRWLGADVTVSSEATVVSGPGADAAALDVVAEVLDGAGATVVTVTAAEPDGTATDGDGDGDEPGEANDGDSGDDDATSGGGSGDDTSSDEESGDDTSSGEESGEANDSDGASRLTVYVGSMDDADIAARLAEVDVSVPADLPAEGYVLAAYASSDGSGTVVLAGVGPAGTFYAAQTLRQLTGDGAVAGVAVVDHPAMEHRGTIEGFYGSPWTTEERLDQLAFYGRFKLNTYVYAPKDDPYHREQWRDPYPADRVEGLRALVDAAAANHVRFTFAVSPGVSICYSDPADRAALVAKLDAVYALGVRSFSVALDDIDHTRWHCPGDEATYGPPSTESAARAQVELLNAVQADFVAGREGARPLQMVPTEYRGTADSPYLTVLREQLDPQIEVMWTGSYVVPAEITVAQAQAAAGTYGRPLFVWDNTPVNDFPPTEGRLILAPYARREAGLSDHVTGIVLNPMNQAAASKVQLVGGADFTWNDAAYDPARAQRAAAEHLAGGDPRTVEALLAFFDLENLAPTSANSGLVSQPQAPALAAQLDAFRTAWDAGDRQAAIDGLRPYADLLAAAPERIRGDVTDPAFVADCGPWLDATALWGQALVATLDGLAADLAGDTAGGTTARARADDLVAQASVIRTIPGETRPEGPVRVADGVLDVFLSEADSLG